MKRVITPEERFRMVQREANNLRMENLDLMQIVAEQEFNICLLELGVTCDDL